MWLSNLLMGISNLVFPPLCKSCDRRMPSNRAVICDQCWDKLPLFDPVEFRKKPVPEFLDNIVSVFLFDDLFQAIVHALKYQGNPSIGRRMGLEMARHLEAATLVNTTTVLLPVPLHPIKRRERGYNQAEMIAEGLRQAWGTPIVADGLCRRKNTVTQTKLNAAERKRNMESAFMVQTGTNFRGETTIILIDDVFTTGATLSAAAQALRSAGVHRVCALTAAAPV